jgi:uncharacterized protein (DUF2252 family)
MGAKSTRAEKPRNAASGGPAAEDVALGAAAAATLGSPGAPAEPLPPQPLPHRAGKPHPSVEERIARGREARRRSPRSACGTWEPGPDRPDPVAILEKQAETREPELVPIRYGRMLASPFAFYRGGAAIMAADLAGSPVTGIHAQLCGDAHMSNFGVFRSPDRSLVVDINDFDETLPGPWEYDLKRLAASFEVAMRDRAVPEQTRRDIVLAVCRSYRTAMVSFAEMTSLDVWYARLDAATLLEKVMAETKKADAAAVAKNLVKAESKDSLRALQKLTRMVDGEPRIISNPPLLVPARELLKGDQLTVFEDVINKFFAGYGSTLPDDRRVLLDSYRFVQIARKVVGVGSVGTRAWIVLLLGKDSNDPLFLQLKQAESSVLEAYVRRSRYNNHGRRVVEGQRLMQAASDILLGWYRVTGFDGVVRDFYVRQLWDGKASANVAEMPTSLFSPFADACGWTLARGHARAADSVAIASYLGKGDVFDRSIADYCVKYADQNERDFEALQAAVKSGRLEAQTGI